MSLTPIYKNITYSITNVGLNQQLIALSQNMVEFISPDSSETDDQIKASSWKLIASGSTYYDKPAYYIVNVASGMALTDSMDPTKGNVTQTPLIKGNIYQEWIFTPTPDNSAYYIQINSGQSACSRVNHPGNLTNLPSNVLKSTWADVNDRTFYWELTILDSEEVLITFSDIEFDNLNAIENSSGANMYSMNLNVNNANNANGITVTESTNISKTSSFQWSLNGSLQIGSKTECKIKIPFAPTTLDLELDLKVGGGVTVKNTNTVDYSSEVSLTVPMGEHDKITALYFNSQNVKIPFRMYLLVGITVGGMSLSTDYVINQITSSGSTCTIVEDGDGNPVVQGKSVLVMLTGNVRAAYAISSNIIASQVS